MRSIAVGASPPTPEWYGLSRNQTGAASTSITTVTPPIIVACTRARSPLSAKKSMKTKMIPADRRRPQRASASLPCVWVDAPPADRLLIEPLPYGRLLGGLQRLDRLQVPEHRDPQGLIRSDRPTASAAIRCARTLRA